MIGISSRDAAMRVASIAAFAFVASGMVAEGAATSPRVSVCVDTSSPTAALDRRVAVAAGRRAGFETTVYAYDGTYGVAEKFFRFLVREHCTLVMGFPVDSVAPDPPDGLALTARYYRTGYVLASIGRPLTVATIPRDSAVAVGLGTVPNFFLVGALGKAPPVRADAYQTQEEAIRALVAGADRSGMLWEPSIVRYRAMHPGAARIVVSPLPIAHDRWGLAALYDPKRSAVVAHRFERAVAGLSASGELATLTNSSSSEFTQ